MESTSKCFSFNTLPMEMKEMVLEKVNPADSMKLLKVNKQLRAYILQQGPFFKRFGKIEYKFKGRNLKIKYHFGEEKTKIRLWLDKDNNLRFTGFTPNLRLPRSTHAQFRFLGNILPPPKTIEVRVSEWRHPTLAFLLPAINLGDLIPKCRFLYRFAYYWEHFFQFDEFMEMFSPKIMHSFMIIYGGVGPSLSKPNSYPRKFMSMLVDCKEMDVYMEDWVEYLYDAMLQSNVEKISVNFDEREGIFSRRCFRKIVIGGIPSQNNQAQIVFKFPIANLSDMDFVISTINNWIDSMGTELPSLRLLAAHTEDGIKYQQLFQEIRAANEIDDDLNLDNLWIYETSSPKKCLFFVYCSFWLDEIYIVSHYA